MSSRALPRTLVLLQLLTVLAGAHAAQAVQPPRQALPMATSQPVEHVLHPRRGALPPRHVRAPHRTAPAPVASPPRRVRRPRKHHAVVRRTRVVVVARDVRTPRERLLAAVARIPGYPAGGATWVVTSAYGHWGMADLQNAIIYISPSVPANRLYDVVAHEWSHVLSVKSYGGDAMRTVTALNGFFGGTDLTGAERAADCMAILLGAHWTHYTPCANARWRDGARKLLAGQAV